MKRLQRGSVFIGEILYLEERETTPLRLSRKVAGLACLKRLLLCSSVLVASCSFASAWLKDKIVQNKNADVSVTIMRWGVPDDDLSAKTEDKKDRFVGQVASDKYQAVTLVFESVPAGGKFFRLPVTTGVHVFTEGRDSYCTLCPRGRNDGYGGGTNAKGAKTSGGCFFEFFIPRQQSLRKLRLVDVLADGQSVYYFTKFNVSCDLLKSPTRVPISKTATLHPVECSLEPVETSSPEKAVNAPVLDRTENEPGSEASEKGVITFMADTSSQTEKALLEGVLVVVYDAGQDQNVVVQGTTGQDGVVHLDVNPAPIYDLVAFLNGYHLLIKKNIRLDRPLKLTMPPLATKQSIAIVDKSGLSLFDEVEKDIQIGATYGGNRECDFRCMNSSCLIGYEKPTLTSIQRCNPGQSFLVKKGGKTAKCNVLRSLPSGFVVQYTISE